MFQKFFNYVIIILFSFIVITSCNLENDYIKSEEKLSQSNTSPEKCYIPQDPLQTIDLVLNGIEKERIGQVLWYLAYNIEWTFEGDASEIPFAGTYYGKWGVQRGLRRFFSILNIKNLELVNQVEGEENITSYTRLQGFIPSRRKTFDMEFVFTWELNELNKIKKCSVTYNVCSFELALSTSRGEAHIVSNISVSQSAQNLYAYFMANVKEACKVQTPEQFRAKDIPIPVPEGAQVEKFTINGFEVERMWNSTSTDDKIILHFHGGGFIAGSMEAGLYRNFSYRLLVNTGIPVFSVNYELAPENPYPAAPENCLAVYQQLLNDYEPENIAFIGVSAGGTLVFTTMLLAKEQNIPLPSAAVACSPWLDISNSGETFNTNADTDALCSIEFLNNCAGYYLNGTSTADPIVSPVFCDVEDLIDFPPIYFTASSGEVLLSDSTRMLTKLIHAGCDVTIELGATMMIHGYWPYQGIPESITTSTRISNFINEKLNNN